MGRGADIKSQIKDTVLEMAAGLNLCDPPTQLFLPFCWRPPKNREVNFGLIKINLVGKNRMKRVGGDVRYFDKSAEGEGTVVYK